MNETEKCQGCIYLAKHGKCTLRKCKGKTVIGEKDGRIFLKKISKKDIPCNDCNFGKLNKNLEMECSKYPTIANVEYLGGRNSARTLGCEKIPEDG